MANNCEACGLAATCKSPHMEPDVIGSKCDVMFVGEAPGADEDRIGKPFVGRSGKLLRSVVEETGIQHYGQVYTNIVHCRPPDNKITAKHIKCCKCNLFEEIEHYNPRLVVLLGGKPLNAVLGKSGITGWRGTLIEREDRAYLPTFHPAYILRNASALEQWLEDFDRVAKWLAGDIDNIDASTYYEMLTVRTEDAASKMVGDIMSAGICSWDTETNGLRYGDEVVMMSFAIDNPKMAWAVVVGGMTKDNVITIEDMVAALLDDENVKKIGHNIKYDVLVAKSNWGVEVGGVVGDSMLLSYLLEPVPGRHGLKMLAGRHLGMYDYDLTLRGYLDTNKDANPKYGGDLRRVPTDVLAEYARLDAVATLELHKVLLAELDDERRVLYEQLMIPASRALAHVEANGVILDGHIVDRYLTIYSRIQQKQLDVLKRDDVVIAYTTHRQKITGKEFAFNPNSSDQVRHVLFGFSANDKTKFRGSYGLKPTTYTPTGRPSTAWDAIKHYPDNTFLGAYRYYKLLGKMINTYLRPAKEKWRGADGRVRSTYMLHGTETGRVASRNPNLLNIPTPEKEPGTLLATLPIKNIFTHTWSDGCIMAVDYAGMELRTMASVSKCVRMMDIFRRGQDPHSMVTEFLYGVKQEDYSDEQWKPIRYTGKWVNWTLLYGGSSHTLHKMYGIPQGEALQLEHKYYDMFPEVLEYREDTLAFARERGYVKSPFGRRRYMPYINDPNDKRRRADERSAINMPIQSGAFDVLLCALVIIDDTMRSNGLKSLMVNTVYDSIMFDVYPGELDDLAWLCKEVMENIVDLGPEWFPGLPFSWFVVPLVADIEVGSHYGCLERYEEGM